MMIVSKKQDIWAQSCQRGATGRNLVEEFRSSGNCLHERTEREGGISETSE